MSIYVLYMVSIVLLGFNTLCDHVSLFAGSVCHVQSPCIWRVTRALPLVLDVASQR